MKIKLNPNFEKLPLTNLYIISIAISLITIVVGLISQIILPPEIPLFYGLPQTEGQLSHSIFIIIPSAISFSITIINSVLATKIHDTFIKKTFAFTSIAIAILAAITTYKILFLVSSF